MEDDGGVVGWESDGTLHIVAGSLTGSELQRVAESVE
jgi:hypothetical protein